MDKIGVLIVTFNRLSLLKEELESIYNQSYNNFDIVVVDNGSTDGTSQWLDRQQKLIVIHQANVGGAGGFFTGMKYIVEHNYKYCWLMDDDVECKADALERLVSKAESLVSFGFLCSRVFGLDGCPMNVPIIDNRVRNGEYPSWLEKIDENLLKVKSSTFVSVFIPTKNIKKVGLPYKEYFIWGDDVEYTTRLSLKLPSFLAFDSIVVHKRQLQKQLNFKTETDIKRLKNYYFYLRNTFFNTLKYGKKKDKIINLGFMADLFIYSICHLDLKRLSILLHVLWGIITFKPKIQYPENGTF